MMSSWSALRAYARHIDERPTGWLTANAFVLGTLLWIIVVPAGRHHILMPMLALTAGLGMLRALAAPNDAVRTRALILAFAAAGSLPVMVGLVGDTPGLTDVAVPLVGGPIAWFAISNLMDSRSRDLVAPVVAIGTVVVTALMLTLVLGVFRGPARLLQPDAFGTRTGGAARANYVGANSLVATVPLLATLWYDRWRYRLSSRGERLIVAGLVIGLGGVAISGRQGVIGAAAMTPILIGVTSLLGFAPKSDLAWPAISRRKVRNVAMTAAGLAIFALALGLTPTRVTSDFVDAVPAGVPSGATTDSVDAVPAGVPSGVTTDSVDAVPAPAKPNVPANRIDAASGVRSRQSASLLRGFSERPILGWGAGAVSPEYPTWRGYEIGTEFTVAPRPWRAEMSYHLLLFEGGLVAAGAYIAATVAAIVVLRRRFRSLPLGLQSLTRAAIVASIALAIASAFNPLTRSVGQQWPLFLPVFLVAGHSVVASKQSAMAPAMLDGSQVS